MSRGNIKRMFRRARWPDDSLAYLSQHLSYLLAAGIPLLESLSLILHHFTPRKREELLRVQKKLESGASLSAALQQINVPPLFLSLVAAGEQHGRYDSSLAFAARYYRRRAIWKHQLCQLVSYPLLLLVLSCVCLWFLLHITLPHLFSIYDTMHLPLPPLTGWFIRVLSVLPASGIAVMGGAALGTGVIWLFWKRESLMFFMLRVPILRYWLKLKITHYFALQGGLLLEAGISVLEVCQLFQAKAPWLFVRNIMQQIEAELKRGHPLSRALQFHSCFTSELVRYVELGEEGGKVAECLLFYSEQMERQIRQQVEKTMRWLEPLILLLVGGVVLIVVLSFFLPVLQMMGELK
ncbi:type II secretion system F family protein [Aneurinibacillus thermoaerophilus]|uniref:Type II secretion system F family protein n=2 Tax=Aneurinibacillus TaxID=55079 RepID=A0A1G7ZMW7_ANETH|nr:type II secretion system F family protein [Aneurinibacillus thermoaerophilus]MED0675651.1 type II secretion system F family protein [Aneurinibacillus thermoaerophilus]MED0757267.1 type II secretion system F family protein [Aneurinibacillus thermoaerophilus]MED0762069.1 type II secretion system F family protein [Aneurinibacillus thermoaerophilus]QYY41784.1 type II secretion system F family protein [Aneurinibacillus thermoaerophilus]SDH10102.1 Type II secretory pathway, component PulF [Aneuri